MWDNLYSKFNVFTLVVSVNLMFTLLHKNHQLCRHNSIPYLTPMKPA